ncbi:peptidase domain-containing ABC transporter [Mangrovibrevibacter kandeliae]|uniref:peptidase domain-containing ABC transporter n=1 Tax=Mangrovibrevibacter kandeliae TaxID=2968473 RepID=UPI0021190279|nr:ATP-binding cassette domain-containing protein [Aurantimonas sp. CSK15Z-1]MCQ8783765.1 ATP-binding cassette domain-containing protein [Aurantimonas sp. CSK15Z-1]
MTALARAGLPAVVDRDENEASAPRTPSRSAVEVAGPDVAALRLLAAIERLADLVRDHRRGVTADPGLERLFCALCISSGINITLRRLLAALPVADEPLDAEAVVCAMSRLGFEARRTDASRGAFEAGSIVLLVPAHADAAVVLAPDETRTPQLLRGDGRTSPASADGAAMAGEAWTFSPKSDSHPLSRTRRGHTRHSWFRALLSQFDDVGLLLVGLAIAIAAAGVLLPLFTIQIYAQVISVGSLDPLPYLAGGMVLAIVIEGLLLRQRTRIVGWLANRIEYLVGTSSFEQLLRIRPAVSENAVVSDQAARLRTLGNIRDFITGPAFLSVLEAPASLASILVIGALGGWLAVVPVVGIGAHLALFVLLRRRARVVTSITADESTEMQRIAIETFEKRAAIRQAGLQHLWSERMVESARRQHAAQLSLRMVPALGEAISHFILVTSAILLLAGGADAVWAGTLGSGGLLAVTILGLRSLVPTHTLCTSIQRFEQLRSSVAQLNTLMEVPPERDDDRGYTQVRGVRGQISLLNAGFRAGDTRPVFVGLDLEIEPGETIAITGAAGSGKTTLLKLMQGLSDLSLGAIRIDGIDIRQLEQQDLRRRIAYVPQDPKLFAGSLRENLWFANPVADDARLRAVLAAVGLDEAVDRLPGGLDHVLEDGAAARLSGGFRFRFALAQALLVESKLLLIDQVPNSVIDDGFGAMITDMIERKHSTLTIIFVSHRSDLIRMADRVVALRYGRVPMVAAPEVVLAKAT